MADAAAVFFPGNIGSWELYGSLADSPENPGRIEEFPDSWRGNVSVVFQILLLAACFVLTTVVSLAMSLTGDLPDEWV